MNKHNKAHQARHFVAAVSQYAKEKSQVVDEAAADAVESAKEKARSVKMEDVKGLIKSFKSDNEDETE